MQHASTIEWVANRIQHPGNDKGDLKRIWTLSFMVGALLFVFVPIVYISSSGSYVLYARELLGMDNHPETYFRTMGYPLLLIVFGVFYLDTFWAVVLAQCAMAITIPIIIYKTISCLLCFSFFDSFISALWFHEIYFDRTIVYFFIGCLPILCL